MRIQLYCGGGLSTSMLIARIEEAARARGLDVHVEAAPLSHAKRISPDVDVVLVGPQVGFALQSYRAEADRLGIPVGVIPHLDYGRMRGDKVLELALKLTGQ